MNPTMSPQTKGVTSLSRNVLCTHYSRCLDVAIDKGWQGFSCSHCEAHEQEASEEYVHWQQQAGRCRSLLTRLFTPKPTRRRTPVIPPRERLDFPMLAQELSDADTEERVRDCIDQETVLLPQAFLAHLMLLLEHRPHE